MVAEQGAPPTLLCSRVSFSPMTVLWDWTFPPAASESELKLESRTTADVTSQFSLTHGYATIKKKISASAIFFESMPYQVDMVSQMHQTSLVSHADPYR